MMINWDNYFIAIARLISIKSKDESTKVGAVIVGPDHEIRSTGFNGAPRGCSEVQIRPLKYAITEHAERNAIYNAARVGISTDKCTMYLMFSPAPCTDCARAIIQAGIIRIVMPDVVFPGKGKNWKEDLIISEKMLKEANVCLDIINCQEIDGCVC